MRSSDEAGPGDPNELCSRIRDGDLAAFEAVFRAYYGPLCGFLRRRLGSLEDAEEAVQDVYLRLWAGRHRLDPDRSLRAYLYRSALNAAANRLKRRRMERGWLRAATPPEPRWPGGEPDDPAHARELAEAIDRALASLPERCRLTFMFSREHGLTYPEIAEALDVSVKTVETQMARALKALRSAVVPHLS